MILRSDARAMMSGDGGGYPKLDFVRGKDSVRVGDQILSSGDGGVFPRGLPVGEAVKGVDNVWRVRLYSNRSAIDFVKVLLFKDFSQLPNADTILRTPPISDVLPPPALPAASSSAGASKSSVAAAPAKTAAAPASAVAKPKPKPAAPDAAASGSAALRPVAPKPVTAASSSAAAPVTPELKPYVPPVTPVTEPSGQN
jgi:rod shape-determining protein MreC